MSEEAPEPDLEEFEAAIRTFRSRFHHAASAMPFFPGVGRTLLPPDWKRPALLVPLDGHYVVQHPVATRPIAWLEKSFEARSERFLSWLGTVKGSLDPASLPKSEIDASTPYLPNPYFGLMDATALTGLLGTLKPQHYIEIGSGISTRFARRAIQQFGLTTRIVCIDPAPRSSVHAIADAVIPKSLLDVDLEIFSSLTENDVIFFDGSHICFSGTDCARFFLEILPAVKAGVFIHIHDISLPNDYPERIRNRYYNEQHLLAAFLFQNEDFEVVLPINYLHIRGYCLEGVSFWMKRRGTTKELIEFETEIGS